MKRAFLLAGVLAALVASLASPAMAADAAPAATERLQALDEQVLAALNKTRADHGLRPLVMSNALQDAAVAHSRAMLEQGFFAHDSPSGAPFVARVRGFYRSAGYDNWTVGENLIYNTEEITADIAIAAWMASPGHRENILTPEWRDVGIGSLHAQSAGGLFAGEPTWVITMDFGARSGKVVTHTKVKQQVAKHKATPKPSPKKAGGKQKTKPDKPARAAKAKPVKKQGTPKPKPVDRVLPRPTHDPADGEGDDRADAADDSAATPEDDTSDDGVEDSDGTDDSDALLEP